MTEIVKVQLAIDMAMARKTARVYADPGVPEIVIYDRARRHLWNGLDPAVRQFMLSAEGGTGYVKAFMWATWKPRPGKWRVDLARGFAPMEDW